VGGKGGFFGEFSEGLIDGIFGSGFFFFSVEE